MPRVWDHYLTDQDRAHLEAQGECTPFGAGQQPAVLSIDNYRQAFGDEPLPLLEAVERWPHSAGLAAWRALEGIERLFAAARAAAAPVVHVTGLAPEDSGVALTSRPRGAWGRTGGRARGEGYDRRYEIVPQAAPQPGEAVVRKAAPSAFFGTPMMAHLNRLGVDTVIVCGGSTSGCVRATVVDARSYHFRVVVPEECVYDRHEAAHAMNLFDMHQKFADVVPLDEVLAYLETVG